VAIYVVALVGAGLLMFAIAKLWLYAMADDRTVVEHKKASWG
jgi:hypothetical protein